MFTREENNIQLIYEAKSILDAIHAYNHGCETCLRHGCKGEFCPAARALKNVSKRREFKKDIQNPTIKKQLAMYLEED